MQNIIYHHDLCSFLIQDICQCDFDRVLSYVFMQVFFLGKYIQTQYTNGTVFLPFALLLLA